MRVESGERRWRCGAVRVESGGSAMRRELAVRCSES